MIQEPLNYNAIIFLQNSLNVKFEPIKAQKLLEFNVPTGETIQIKQFLKHNTIGFLLTHLFQEPSAYKLDFVSQHIAIEDVAQFVYYAKITPNTYQNYFDYYINNFKNTAPHDMACLLTRYILGHEKFIGITPPSGNHIYFRENKLLHVMAVSGESEDIFRIVDHEEIEPCNFSLDNENFPIMFYLFQRLDLTFEKKLELLSCFNKPFIKEDGQQLEADKILEALQNHLKTHNNTMCYAVSLIQDSLSFLEKHILERDCHSIKIKPELDKKTFKL